MIFQFIKIWIADRIYRHRFNQAVRRNDTPRCIQLLDAHIKFIEPDFSLEMVDLLSLRGLHQTHRQALDLAKDDFDQAESLMDGIPAHRYKRRKAIIYFRRGVYFLACNQYYEAIRDFSESIRANPASWEGYFFRSLAYIAVDEFRSAARNLEQALSEQLPPNVRIGLTIDHAHLLVRLGKIEQGIRELECITLHTDDTVRNYKISYIYQSAERYAEAIAYINYAIEKSPKQVESWQSRAWSYAQMRDFDRAVADSRKITQLQPDGALAHNNLAFYLLLQKNFAEAEEEVEKALQLDNKLAYAYGTRGHLHFLKGEYEAALADFKREHEIAQDDTSIRYGHAGEAMTCYRLGQIDEAKNIWKSLLAQSSDYSSIDSFKKKHIWADECLEVIQQIIEAITASDELKPSD